MSDLTKDAASEDVEYILQGLRNSMVGNVYIWQPENRQNPRAYARVRVTEVLYDGDEFIVKTVRADRRNADTAFNSLTHFLTMIAAETQ